VLSEILQRGGGAEGGSRWRWVLARLPLPRHLARPAGPRGSRGARPGRDTCGLPPGWSNACRMPRCRALAWGACASRVLGAGIRGAARPAAPPPAGPAAMAGRACRHGRRISNAYAERWVKAVKEGALSRLILCGEVSLRHALTQSVAHFHHERTQQGKGNVLLLPTVNQDPARAGLIRCRERLGRLLKYYEREAA